MCRTTPERIGSSISLVLVLPCVYRQAIRHDDCTPAEREAFERVLALFEAACDTADDDATVGEALARTMDQLSREIVATLPRLSLTSLTRSPVRAILADGLATITGGMAEALGRWADRTNTPMWPLVAVATDPDGTAQRARFHAAQRRFDIAPLLAGGHESQRPRPLAADDLVELLRRGRLAPGARLVALAEASLAGRGIAVRHFGNAARPPDPRGSSYHVLGRDHLGPDTVIDHRPPRGGAKRRRQPHRARQTGH